MNVRSRAGRRWAWRLGAGLAIVLLAVATVPPWRYTALRAAGAALVVDNAPAGAEVVALPTGIGPPGELEVADLVRERQVGRVLVLSPDPPAALADEYARRGVPLESPALRSREMLTRLGVDPARIELLDVPVGGTTGESSALARWCSERGVRAVLVVSSRHHSRRLTRLLRRATRGHDLATSVRPTRYDSFDPDDWWQHRDSLRAGLIELQKLLLDVVRHPLS